MFNGRRADKAQGLDIERLAGRIVGLTQQHDLLLLETFFQDPPIEGEMALFFKPQEPNLAAGVV